MALIGHLFHSKFNEKARGTAILICKNIQFEPHKTVAQVALLLSQTTGRPVVLANVYGPNWDDSVFITKLFTSFPNIDNYHIIVGGDFNLVQDPILDRSSNKVFPLPSQLRLLALSLNNLGFQTHGAVNFPQLNFSLFSHMYTALILA